MPLGLDMLETGRLPAMPERETLHQESGWLGACAAQPGVGCGPAAADSVARALSALISGSEKRGDALALTVGIGPDVLLVIFACRAQTFGPDDEAAYEQLHHELTQLLLRSEDESDEAPTVPMSWAAGG